MGHPIDSYDAHVTHDVVGEYSWWCFSFTWDGSPVVESGFDVCATSEREATRIALEHVHGRIMACHEMACDGDNDGYYQHQLRQLNALARHGARFEFTGESVVCLD